MKIRKTILGYNVLYRHFAWASCSSAQLFQAVFRPLCSLRKLLFSVFLFSGLLFPALAAAVTPMVVAGRDHTVALQADGTVMTWGDNDYGQLGDNTTVSKRTFVQATGISNAVAIACCARYTIAIRSDGNVFACGYNSQGQLGDNTVVGKSTFVQAIGI